MARGRMVHACLWRSEEFVAFGLRERLLWIGLVTTADDQGRGRAHPGLVRADVFPLEDVALEEIAGALQAFEEHGMLVRYMADGKELYQIRNWWEYQGSMAWAWPSDYPPPEGWSDRIRYRKGNAVVEENWSDEPEESEPTASPPRADDEPTASPPRADDEPTVSPLRADGESKANSAPNGNGNGNTKKNGKETLQGAGAPRAPPVSVPTSWAQWEEYLETVQNRPALVHRMVEELYTGLDPPGYGEIGAIAKRMGRGVNGYRRLMSLLWEYSARPPKGDLLPYLLRVHQGKERARERSPPDDHTSKEARRRYASDLTMPIVPAEAEEAEDGPTG